MSNLFTIKRKDLLDLLQRMSATEAVYVPYARKGNLSFGLFNRDMTNAIELGVIRQDQPIKTFLAPPRKGLERAGDTPGRAIIAGVKQCDLMSLALQDFVFLGGDVKDPFYMRKREDLFIISCDCTEAKETCFCVAMEGHPFPSKSFDLNLSLLGEECVVEAGSEKGRELVRQFKAFFATAADGDAVKRGDARLRVEGEVVSFIKARGTPSTGEIAGAVMKNYASPIWKDFYATCVECGACNLACPTCHCFLLYDEILNGTPKRFMEWDACLYKRFARVAGGANPRKYLWERLRNRFEKKFDFFPKVIGANACTGCGRCIDACPGDIDIREVLKGLVTGQWSKPPNK